MTISIASSHDFSLLKAEYLCVAKAAMVGRIMLPPAPKGASESDCLAVLNLVLYIPLDHPFV